MEFCGHEDRSVPPTKVIRPVTTTLQTATDYGDLLSPVVQIYYRPDATEQPVRLVGWTAVEVSAGESATVQVTTDARLWRRWDPAANSWGTPLSAGDRLIARRLGDIRAELGL